MLGVPPHLEPCLAEETSNALYELALHHRFKVCLNGPCAGACKQAGVFVGVVSESLLSSRFLQKVAAGFVKHHRNPSRDPFFPSSSLFGQCHPVVEYASSNIYWDLLPLRRVVFEIFTANPPGSSGGDEAVIVTDTIKARCSTEVITVDHSIDPSVAAPLFDASAAAGTSDVSEPSWLGVGGRTPFLEAESRRALYVAHAGGIHGDEALRRGLFYALVGAVDVGGGADGNAGMAAYPDRVEVGEASLDRVKVAILRSESAFVCSLYLRCPALLSIVSTLYPLFFIIILWW